MIAVGLVGERKSERILLADAFFSSTAAADAAPTAKAMCGGGDFVPSEGSGNILRVGRLGLGEDKTGDAGLLLLLLRLLLVRLLVEGGWFLF